MGTPFKELYSPADTLHEKLISMAKATAGFP